jgi:hypothetical protein
VCSPCESNNMTGTILRPIWAPMRLSCFSYLFIEYGAHLHEGRPAWNTTHTSRPWNRWQVSSDVHKIISSRLQGFSKRRSLRFDLYMRGVKISLLAYNANENNYPRFIPKAFGRIFPEWVCAPRDILSLSWLHSVARKRVSFLLSYRRVKFK